MARPGTGQFVDGFLRPSRGAVATKPAAHGHNRVAISLTAHKPEPTKTLMRSAVRKPDIVAPSKLKAQSRTDSLAKAPKQIITPKVSHSSVDAKRLKKANQMVKHPHISHYGSSDALAATARSVPVNAQSLHGSSTIDRIQSSITQATGPTSRSAVPVIPVILEPKPVVAKDMFSEALARATSHEQTYEPALIEAKKQRRGAILVTSVLCLLLFAGTFAYLNAPALSLKVASVKAGFSAKLPGFVPVGFNFGNLSYGKGNVTVSYSSAADANKRYDITQRESSWDSQTLLANFVSSANKAYQTYQQAGRTVYMYGDNTATWVDSGVWYTVNGNSALSRDQILNLAGSL